jgi:phospholipid transport system substrate-binding protein
MQAVSRRLVLPLALAGIALPGLARADMAAEARQPILELYTGLEKLMRAGRAAPFPKRFEILAPVIDKGFDLETILRVSVGLRWPVLDETSRVTLTKVFRQFTIASYVANFDSYDGERFEVLPVPRMSGSNQIVQSRIVASTGEPIKMDYVMQHAERGWRVIDVLLDGSISRVAVQRSDFRGLLATGDASALIDSLRQKVTVLSGGTLVS